MERLMNIDDITELMKLHIQMIKKNKGKVRQDFRNAARLTFQIYTRQLPRMVSVKADEYNRSNKNYDLQKKSYKDGNGDMMLEHTTPLMSFIDYLTTIPTENIKDEILNYSGICWVLKEEDDVLRKLGFRNKRPDWKKAYKKAGIDLAD